MSHFDDTSRPHDSLCSTLAAVLTRALGFEPEGALDGVVGVTGHHVQVEQLRIQALLQQQYSHVLELAL